MESGNRRHRTLRQGGKGKDKRSTKGESGPPQSSPRLTVTRNISRVEPNFIHSKSVRITLIRDYNLRTDLQKFNWYEFTFNCYSYDNNTKLNRIATRGCLPSVKCYRDLYRRQRHLVASRKLSYSGPERNPSHCLDFVI